MRIPRRAHMITAVLTAVILSTAGATGALASQGSPAHVQDSGGSSTATPIKHLVVIFDENISFDHYFGTYPYAPNTAGSRPSTPSRVRRRSTACTTSLGPGGPPARC